jgi:hypothetical protein
LAAILFLIALLLVVFVFINPNKAWVLPEAYVYKDHIIKMLYSDHPGALWLKWLDFEAFEFSSRTTRPLSSALEIADTLTRHLLWKFVPPLTSLSLTWLLTLFATPLLLFRLLRCLGFAKEYSLLGVAFYFVHPGTVSLYSLLFRPGKSVVEFLIVAAGYVAIQDPKSSVAEKKQGWLVRGLILLACLFDETGIIVVFFVTLLRPNFLFGSVRCVVATTVVPCILGVVYYSLPFLSVWAGYPKQNLFKYEVFAGPRDVLYHFWENLEVNYRLIFCESLALFDPHRLPAGPLRLLFLLNIIGVCSLVLYCAYVYLKSWSYRQSALSSSFRWPIRRIVVGIALLVPFHTFILNLVSDAVWGPYWYGAYFGIFFAILIVAVSQYINRFVVTFPIVLLLLLTSVHASSRTNLLYKKFHYYPYAPGNIQGFFLGNINRFSSDQNFNYKPQSTVLRLWKNGKQTSLVGDEQFPREAFWLPLELGWFIDRGPVTVGYVVNTKFGQPFFPLIAP